MTAAAISVAARMLSAPDAWKHDSTHLLLVAMRRGDAELVEESSVSPFGPWDVWYRLARLEGVSKELAELGAANLCLSATLHWPAHQGWTQDSAMERLQEARDQGSDVYFAWLKQQVENTGGPQLDRAA